MNSIEWKPKAAHQLRKITQKVKRELIYDAAQQLIDWPRCTGDVKRLQGRDGYRLRVDDYRVIFEIDQSGTPIIIHITQVEKRSERTY